MVNPDSEPPRRVIVAFMILTATIIIVAAVLLYIYSHYYSKGGLSQVGVLPNNWFHHSSVSGTNKILDGVTQSTAKQLVGTSGYTAVTWVPDGNANSNTGTAYGTKETDWVKFASDMVIVNLCGNDNIGSLVPITYFSLNTFPSTKRKPTINELTTPYTEEFIHNIPTDVPVSDQWSAYRDGRYTADSAGMAVGFCRNDKNKTFYNCPIFWQLAGSPTYTIGQTKLYLYGTRLNPSIQNTVKPMTQPIAPQVAISTDNILATVLGEGSCGFNSGDSSSFFPKACTSSV